MNHKCLVAESQCGVKEGMYFSEHSFLIFEMNILAWESKSDMLKFQIPVRLQTAYVTLGKVTQPPPSLV